VNEFPNTMVAEIMGRQVVRSASSVGANYRAACRAKSTADIINKLKSVEEEADETLYWLELIIETGVMPSHRISELMTESDEIIAMTVASIKTLRKKQQSISP
jgi:four helix bundle protein